MSLRRDPSKLGPALTAHGRKGRTLDAMTSELDRDYAHAGFDGALDFGDRPALIVVDVVQAYLREDSSLYAGVEAALASMLRLIDAARRFAVPIIYTNVAYQADGMDGGLFYRKVPALKLFDAGSPYGAFADGVAPLPGELVVTKQYASAFFGTSLASTLHALRTDTVILGGFSTSGCVRATALDALQHGFAPFLVREACGDRNPEVQAANLFDLQAKYAEVVDEITLIERLERSRRV